MKRIWRGDELIDQWTLSPEELGFVNTTYPEKNKLGFAVLLKLETTPKQGLRQHAAESDSDIQQQAQVSNRTNTG